MEGCFNFLSLLCLILVFPYPSSSLPLCTDLRAPLRGIRLSFCPYNGRVCCDSAKDLHLRRQFQAMNISDIGCASAMKSILCATCDQFSAELYRVESKPRPVPVLCNSTNSSNSSLSTHAPKSFCSSLWDTCQEVPILNSPFAPSLQGRGGVSHNSTSSTLTSLWQSKSNFCDAFGGVSDEDSYCFNGEPISLNESEASLPPSGICLEKIGNRSYINLVAHPDGSNRAFFSNQAGKIWLATIPEQGSGQTLAIDESSPFVDLSDEVYFYGTFGMMGLAFHPNFARNGRFFASYNCDKVKSTDCAGRCACNSDVNCDPAKLSSPRADHPCQYHTVVAEFSASVTALDPSSADKANPTEVRRIFTMGLPSAHNHGGQILFGPADGNLYLMMGDGGVKGDPYNFSQNKKSLLGKIMRLNVDNIPSEEEIVNLGLWGNYSIPQGNPYTGNRETQHEIWARGLRSPWRCSFDAERPSYFLCADAGQDRYEEVDIITKGGNYGWSMYEGPLSFNSQHPPGGNTSNSTNIIFPVMGYNHSDINKNVVSATIIGGYFYRSTTDPCLHGSYLYADLYASAIWAASETPKNSGNFTSNRVPFTCARDSPMECGSVPNSPLPALQLISSFGEDNRRDIYILASSGVYRVVRPSRCNYTCSSENVTAAEAPRPSPPSSGTNQIADKYVELQLFISSLSVLVGLFLL